MPQHGFRVSKNEYQDHGQDLLHPLDLEEIRGLSMPPATSDLPTIPPSVFGGGIGGMWIGFEQRFLCGGMATESG